MRRPAIVLLLAAIFGGGYVFFQKFQLEGLEHIAVRPKEASVAGAPADPLSSVPVRDSGSIRIATFNIQVFGVSKLAKPAVMEILADVVRKFDVVAIQEIRATSDDILPRFVEIINSTGRHYDYVIGPRLGRTNSKEQYAYVYDAQTVECDRQSLYTVHDPDDLLHREPLVASFRARGPPPEQAFTFTLINIHTDPDDVPNEIAALAQVYRSVRSDGRGEDDILLLGDLNANDKQFGALGQLPSMMWAISGVPTNTRGTKQYDNILFNRIATVEYTGRAGVLDLLREYNLTQEQALQISDHLPVWAEFSNYEGGQPGRIATKPEATLPR